MILNSAHPICFGKQRILTMTVEQDLPTTVCGIRNAKLQYVYVHTRSPELLVVIYEPEYTVSPKIMLCGLSFRVLRRRLRGALKVIVRPFQRSQQTYFNLSYRATFGGPQNI